MKLLILIACFSATLFAGESAAFLVGEWTPLPIERNGETIQSKERHVITARDWRIITAESERTLTFKVQHVLKDRVVLVSPNASEGQRFVVAWIENGVLYRTPASGSPSQWGKSFIQFALKKTKDLPTEAVQIDIEAAAYTKQRADAGEARKRDKSIAKVEISQRLRAIKNSGEGIALSRKQIEIEDANLEEGIKRERPEAEQLAFWRANHKERIDTLKKDLAEQEARKKTAVVRLEEEIAELRKDAALTDDEFAQAIREAQK